MNATRSAGTSTKLETIIVRKPKTITVRWFAFPGRSSFEHVIAHGVSHDSFAGLVQHQAFVHASSPDWTSSARSAR